MNKIEQLQESLIVLKAEANKINEEFNTSESLDEAKLVRLDEISKEVKTIVSTIGILQNSNSTFDQLEKPVARISKPCTPDPINTIPATPKDEVLEKNGGWKSHGEFLQAVKNAASGIIDRRLIEDTDDTIFGNTGVGAEGGFAVPVTFGSEILRHAFPDAAFLAMTDNTALSNSNTFSVPISEETAYSTGGVTCTWSGEGVAPTTTDPNLGDIELRLNKIISVVKISDELSRDASAMESFVVSRMGEAIQYKTSNALYRGDGAGKPLGVLNSPALVTVTRTGANAVVAADVVNMFARMPDASNGVFIANNDVFPQIMVMTLGDQPIFSMITTGGLTSSPGGFLMGRPLILSQHASTLGTVGDIMFIDWKKYLTITQGSGIVTSSSIHLNFAQDLVAFKSTFRVDGGTRLTKVITPDNGSNNLSWYIALSTV